MRIISGELRGRIFNAPSTARTHPMGEKPRGALFNALGDISGLTFFDAYAGSGALSFEAISRGAKDVVAVEIDKSAYKTLTQNIFMLGLGQMVHAHMANVRSWLARNETELFDVVLCDPPYDAVQASDIEKIAKHVRVNGLLVLSWPSKLSGPSLSDCTILSEKEYAGARIIFYRR